MREAESTEKKKLYVFARSVLGKEKTRSFSISRLQT